MGALIRASFDKGWGKNPARKASAKGQVNSLWGKHVQRPIMPEMAILSTTDVNPARAFYNNVSSGNYAFLSTLPLGEDRTLFRYLRNGPSISPDINNSYLPAALFVPAYGRLRLFDAMELLGDRVLMHDTDSIIYIDDPDLPSIPTGKVWGDWDVEDIDARHGGIRTFVGVGPKTYALRAGDGTTMFKCKGLSLRWGTDPYVNFNTMEDLVKEFLETGEARTIDVPQMGFVYRVGEGLHTHHFVKQLTIEMNALKGQLSDDPVLRREGYIYPFGYVPPTV